MFIWYAPSGENRGMCTADYVYVNYLSCLPYHRLGPKGGKGAYFTSLSRVAKDNPLYVDPEAVVGAGDGAEAA